jgi:hypothetical protein
MKLEQALQLARESEQEVVMELQLERGRAKGWAQQSEREQPEQQQPQVM